MNPLELKLATTGLVGTALHAVPARAEDSRKSLDTAISAGNVPQFLSMSAKDQNPGSQADILRDLKAKFDSGEAPNQFGIMMISSSLAGRNIDDALMYLAYTAAISSIDSAACPDRSASTAALQSLRFFTSALSASEPITAEQKHRAVERALVLEAATAPSRRKNALFCTVGSGLAQLPPNTPQAGDGAVGGPESQSNALHADEPGWASSRLRLLPDLTKYISVFVGLAPGQ